MCSLDSLHVEVEDVWLVGMRPHRGISAIRQRAGLPVAETGAADLKLVDFVSMIYVYGFTYTLYSFRQKLVCFWLFGVLQTGLAAGVRKNKRARTRYEPYLECAEVLVDVLPLKKLV